MKLIIQIPCYNEEATLAATLADLPRAIEGFDEIEVLVVDDGSTDDTKGVARRCGVTHVVSHPRNLGLARAFMTGIETALELGADIIVNTDADNQYCADDIQVLVGPVLQGNADIVIGGRPITAIDSFSPIKKILQRAGSAVVRAVSGVPIPDAPSGFRAFSRKAALQINVFNAYTYTLETLIQAGQKRMAVISVPVRVNRQRRPSRLVRSSLDYVLRSMVTIVRMFSVYHAFRFFMMLALLSFVAGFLIGVRFVFAYLAGTGGGMVQSLILAALLMGIGMQMAVLAFIADLIAVNRMLLEKLEARARGMK